MFKRVHTKPGLLPIKQHRPGFLQVGHYADVPDISAAPTNLPAAWFLGPRAENKELMSWFLTEALNHITDYRLNYQADDPISITSEIKESKDYIDSVDTMKTSFKWILNYFNKFETPYFSLRYIGHMLSENTLPALVGGFAAMLHNPNNVTIQASTSTTLLEMVAMHDLCHMVGWNASETAPIQAWAHITADGSIANVESLWATREVKFLPFAVVAALNAEPTLNAAKNITVPLTDGTDIPILEANSWQLFNIRRDDILALPDRIATEAGLEEYDVWNLLVPYGLNAKGLLAAGTALAGLGGVPVLLTPSTRHYSWPKAAAILGFGTDADQTVKVDRLARMDINDLRARLEYCLTEKVPVLMVVSVNGSTEESAIDPLTDIQQLRDEYRKRGLEFDIHVDAAWGGYITSVIRKNYDQTGGDLENPFLEDVSKVPLSDYAVAQFRAMRGADSITIDPHKCGYVQYGAGSLLYRNMKVINLLTFTGAYIGAATDPTMGMFGVEGSKPGAAAAAVYFSHMCIRPSVSGFGRILSCSLANARQFYTRLLFIADPEGDVSCVPLALLPAEQEGGDVEEQLEFLKTRIYQHTTEAIENDPEAMHLFRKLGPDQNIVDYGFKWKLNTDPEVYNARIQEIYNAFHVYYNPDASVINIHDYPMMVTMTTFDLATYGEKFMETFARRLELKGVPEKLNCLRSVLMNPFVSDTVDGSFLDPLVGMLRDKAIEVGL